MIELQGPKIESVLQTFSVFFTKTSAT